MSIGSLTTIASDYAQSLISGLAGNSSSNKTVANKVSSVPQTADINQLSPFAGLLSTLQQLQQSNSTQYSQITQQIATNLTTAANTATANGNTTAAATLNQLASDFTSASQTGQLPNVEDLAKAVHHGHGHHCHASSGGANPSDPSSAGSTSSSAGSATSDLLSQLISSYQATTAGNSQLVDPMTIIDNTLASAGIGQ